MKKIFLIRHGETESNRKGIFRGRLNIPLSLKGKEQGLELRQYFEHIPIDIIYTSPLQRAIETAQIAFPTHSATPEPLLDNLDLGTWSGMDKEMVKEQFPQQWDTWIKRPESITFPGGESLRDVMKRINLFFQKIIDGKEENIAAVSHRSVLKVMLAVVVGIEKNYFWKFHLDNASVCQVYFDTERGFTLVKSNETHHLKNMVMEWY